MRLYFSQFTMPRCEDLESAYDSCSLLHNIYGLGIMATFRVSYHVLFSRPSPTEKRREKAGKDERRKSLAVTL